MTETFKASPHEAIEPDIQDTILTALPGDGPLALEVMAQLSANMVLSIRGADLESFIERVRHHYISYSNVTGPSCRDRIIRS